MVISHNMMAMNAQIQFNMSTGRMKKVTEKLSSGYKINRAADDAAGLSISENMRRQIRGLERGATNTQDGISFCQVADGALSEIHSMLHRMNELCVQAANGTNSDADRGYIDSEIQSLKSEISRIVDTTEFNGKKIWHDFDSEGVGRIAIPGEYQKVVDVIGIKGMQLNGNNISMLAADYNYYYNVDDDEFSLNWTGFDGHNYKYSKSIQDFLENPLIELNEFQDLTIGQTISKEMGYKAYFDISPDAEIDDIKAVLNGKKIGTVIYTQTGTGQAFCVGNISPWTEGWVEFDSGSLRMDAIYASNPDGAVMFESLCTGEPQSNVFFDGANWTVRFSYGDLENVRATNTKVTWQAVDNIDGEWQTILSGSTDQTGIEGIRDALLDPVKGLFSDAVGRAYNFGQISLLFNITSSSSQVVDVGDFRINISFGSGETESNVINKINTAFGEGSIIKMTMYYPHDMGSSTDLSDNNQIPVYKHPMSLNIHTGSAMDDELSINYYEVSLADMGVKNINAKTEETAKYGLQQVSKAIDRISSERANFGAQQNRLEHTYDVNKNTAENVQAAESRIRDADLAKEMVEFSKHKMLEQVGESMISQANQSQQGILNLLQ